MKSPHSFAGYDSIAKKYIPHVEAACSWNNLYERPAMISLFDDFSGKNVLDIGCASGYYTQYALEHNACVTAVDISRKMLDHLNSTITSDKLTTIKADVKKGLPFLADASQHFIICSLMIHYIEHWEPLVSDCFRVLKPGGKMYVSTHHPMNDFIYLKKQSYFDSYLAHDTWGSPGNRFNVDYYTRPLRDILKPFTDSQFRIASLEEPLPSERCRETAPETYRRLMEKPPFLFLVLEKMSR